ncbi:hypothetical protein QAD02_017836 [Eretmocerus hayati]|uniref:Uncharacterized protein n=1 Tax=Eretmocerus hayati TaxID=131215 RepID=A0ACC2PER5_9HYME|nr:hypothetical protein QAD02_017836 [Eretmocerus hayati]
MYWLFRFLLHTLHFLCSFYEFVRQQCALLIWSLEQRGYWGDVHKYSLSKFSPRLDELSRIPKHLVFLMGHEEVSVLDIASIIGWCTTAGIPFVTFYEHKENLQDSLGLVKKKLDELEPDVSASVEWTSSVTSVSDHSKNGMNGISPNGIHSKIIPSDLPNSIERRKTKVQILSYDTGKKRIVSLTRSLAYAVKFSIVQEEDITSELLEEKLTFNGKLTDPDLAIVFGKTMCTWGFSPWQARITQFFLLPTHHNISSHIFIDTLNKFSKCQQRHGK